MSGPRKHLLLKRLALLAFSVVVVLVGIEIFLRMQHAKRQEALGIVAQADGNGSVIHSDVPGLFYEFAPSPPEVNSRGFPDVEHALEKPEGVFRIVIIGDSIAAGHGMPREDRFTRLLETMHNERCPDRPIEVIVLARSGYCTSQELVLLREYAMDYDPDLILWSYVLNDPADPFYHGSNGELMAAYNPPCHLAVLLRKGLIGLAELFADSRADEEFHRKLHLLYRDRIARAFAEIGQFSKENDVPIVVILHPVFLLDPLWTERADLPYSWQDVHDDLRAIIEPNGMQVVDIQDAITGEPPADFVLPDDPWHPSLKGHRRAAEWLLEKLDLPAADALEGASE